MILPTTAQLTAATQAARKAIDDYSSFDSSMVPDAALTTVVESALIAALNVQPQKGKKP
jgi:hypothetical protein